MSNLLVQWKAFLSFCAHFKFQWLPATSNMLCLYAQFLCRSFKAPSSIKNYISGIKTLHILMELPVTAFQSHEIKLALRGISRLKPHCPKKAYPVTPQILHQIHGVFDFNNPAHTVFWSLFLLAFFTMSRKSNLVVTGNASQSKQLRRQDVVVGSKGMLVISNGQKPSSLVKECFKSHL